MNMERALKVVLELAEQNVMSEGDAQENQLEDMLQEQYDSIEEVGSYVEGVQAFEQQLDDTVWVACNHPDYFGKVIEAMGWEDLRARVTGEKPRSLTDRFFAEIRQFRIARETA